MNERELVRQLRAKHQEVDGVCVHCDEEWPCADAALIDHSEVLVERVREEMV